MSAEAQRVLRQFGTLNRSAEMWLVSNQLSHAPRVEGHLAPERDRGQGTQQIASVWRTCGGPEQASGAAGTRWPQRRTCLHSGRRNPLLALVRLTHGNLSPILGPLSIRMRKVRCADVSDVSELTLGGESIVHQRPVRRPLDVPRTSSANDESSTDPPAGASKVTSHSAKLPGVERAGVPLTFKYLMSLVSAPLTRTILQTARPG